MAKESKAAESGPTEVRPQPVAEAFAAPPRPGSIKTVDEWAVEKGFADVVAPHPFYANRGWVQVLKNAGPANRALFAFAKAYFQWPIGKLLTEAEFDAAMKEIGERKFGEHPVKS